MDNKRYAELLSVLASTATTSDGKSSCGGDIISHDDTLTPTKREVNACAFPSWYKRFRRRSDHGSTSTTNNTTPRSIIIPLPADFTDWLLRDGIRLPVEASRVSSCVDGVVADADDDDDSWDHDDDDDDEEETPYSCPALTDAVAKAIATLGGSACPTLTWSCPRDATWMNGGSLQCRTPGDVYVLLKASDFVVHDLLHAYDDLRPEAERPEPAAVPHVLVLRTWCRLFPSMEFRCFVASRTLVAISQRDHTQCYPFLSSDQWRIRHIISEFFEERSNDDDDDGLFPLTNYVFDCYVDRDERVWIVDFNVWGTRTDALLFTWPELTAMDRAATVDEIISSHHGIDDSLPLENGKDDDDDDVIDTTKNPEIRIVQNENEVRHDPLASYRAPIDTVDLANDALGANSFADFIKMCERPSAPEERKD